MLLPVSIFLLVASTVAHQSCSVPQHTFIQNNVQFCCIQVGGVWSYSPKTCVGLRGQFVNLGETSIEYLGQGFAFVYKCSANSATGGWSYSPIACSSSNNPGNYYNPSQNFSSGQFHWQCEHDGKGGLNVRPIACLNNGKQYTHGQIATVCDQYGNCGNFQCTIQGMQANFSCQSCQIGNQVVPSGQQVIWQQRQCSCQQTGVHCHSHGK